jgi:hypothetical protein
MAIERVGKILLGTILRFDYEVRDEKEIARSVPSPRLPKEMLGLASHILDTKAGHFDGRSLFVAATPSNGPALGLVAEWCSVPLSDVSRCSKIRIQSAWKFTQSPHRHGRATVEGWRARAPSQF